MYFSASGPAISTNLEHLKKWESIKDLLKSGLSWSFEQISCSQDPEQDS